MAKTTITMKSETLNEIHKMQKAFMMRFGKTISQNDIIERLLPDDLEDMEIFEDEDGEECEGEENE